MAPFEPQLKTALESERSWLTLVLVPYHIGILNKLNVHVSNGHIYEFLEKSGDSYLGVVFNEKTHRDLRF